MRGMGKITSGFRSATVFAMVALPKRDSLHGLVSPCSQAQETKTRMMWENCLTIPTIISHIFHNFVLLFLILVSRGKIPQSENSLLKITLNPQLAKFDSFVREILLQLFKILGNHFK